MLQVEDSIPRRGSSTRKRRVLPAFIFIAGGFRVHHECSLPEGPAHRQASRRLGQIAGTVLILVLICRWLGIHRDLAGFPRQRRVSPVPALITVLICVAGQLIANLVLNALTPASATTNSNGGGGVDNGWGWLQIIDAVHTSIVEEIIVVAVPVLIGRRAGWHPVVLIAVC